MVYIQLDPQSLEYICDDEGGRYKWYYDASGEQYVCLNSETNRYTYRIPKESLPNREQFMFRKMSRLIKDGLDKYIPREKLQQISAPRSQAVLKILAHRGGLHGNNN